ncbi:hypothetical protein E2562_004564 [Oryza meyeriana var. granulata]|uniref:Uncharacterized protein n=1 Tax=Oryza meyeriana var. granulata TaxID=110450 RepID=A0A6G1F3E9_9ORYZ|nr:hypothetical protein E2562_004564 [Oryza meyeriana var. granulata]
MGTSNDTEIEDYVVGTSESDAGKNKQQRDTVTLYGPEQGLSWVAQPVSGGRSSILGSALELQASRQGSILYAHIVGDWWHVFVARRLMWSSHNHVTRLQGGNHHGHDKNHPKTSRKNNNKKKATVPRKTTGMTRYSSRRRLDHPSYRMHRSHRKQTLLAKLGHGGRFVRLTSTLRSYVVSGRSEADVGFP